MPEHVDIVDGKRHEPKGASTAIAETVYVADGAGSGTWKGVEPAGVATQVEGKTYISDGAGSGTWEFLPQGWGMYTDGQSSPATISVGTSEVKLLVDGAGSTSSSAWLPKEIRGTGELWDTSNSLMTPIASGDAYDVRLDLVISGTTGSPTYIEVILDIGGDVTPTIPIVTKFMPIYKSPPEAISVAVPLFALGTFLANGCQIFLVVDSGTATISERSIFISRNSSGEL